METSGITITDIVTIISYIIAAASLLANFTKSSSDNIWMARIGKFFDMFAANYYKK